MSKKSEAADALVLIADYADKQKWSLVAAFVAIVCHGLDAEVPNETRRTITVNSEELKQFLQKYSVTHLTAEAEDGSTDITFTIKPVG